MEGQIEKTEIVEMKGTTPVSAMSGSGEIIMPQIEKAKQWSSAFERLKDALLEVGKDKVNIQGKMAITRGGFSKLLLAFGGSSETIITGRIEKGKRGDSEYEYEVYASTRAWLPNGRQVTATESCSTLEFTPNENSDKFIIEGTAGTRSFNRAIANLLGGGMVSAEELKDQGGDMTEPKITEKQLAYLKNLNAKSANPQDPIGFDNMTKKQANELIEKLKGGT